jgi:ATP-dependent DNA helicase RecG
MNLVENLKRSEGKTLEFRRNPSSPDGALKTLVVFANTSGVMLPVGVEDRTRQVRRLPAALERLASLSRGLVREIGTGPQDPRRRSFLAERRPA